MESEISDKVLEAVTCLDLADNDDIPDEYLRYIGACINLIQLDLFGTGITDVVWEYLNRHTSLEKLNLGHTLVTDTGLITLKKLHRLRELDLSHTPITDAGLLHFIERGCLRKLNLTGSQVTENGVSQLRATMPRLQVTLDKRCRIPCNANKVKKMQ